MLPFSYEDRHPTYAAPGGFGATNEEPLIIKELVKPFNNGLGIASAGEVTFFNLLPKAKGQLVLIDHSYNSLRAFCLKALFLATLGPEATRKLLIENKTEGCVEAVAKVNDMLPPKLQGTTATGYQTDKFLSEAHHIRREWFYGDLAALKKAAANLHKIKLIHGDLLDTADRAPYDFLYLSNALEHKGRTNSNPGVGDLTALLTVKANILWMTSNGGIYNSNKMASCVWEPKKEVYGYRTTWTYRLSIKKKLKATTAAA